MEKISSDQRTDSLHPSRSAVAAGQHLEVLIENRTQNEGQSKCVRLHDCPLFANAHLYFDRSDGSIELLHLNNVHLEQS